MDNTSTPSYNRRVHRGSPNYFKSGSPYSSPHQDRPPPFGSPDFNPYSYSSPIKRGSPNYYGPKQQDRNSRYYGNQGGQSPYDRSNRSNYGNHNRNRQNFRKCDLDISLYVHKSMLEDPWAELENKPSAAPPPSLVPDSSEPPSEASSVSIDHNETEDSSILLDTEDGDTSTNEVDSFSSSMIDSEALEKSDVRL